MRKSIVLIAVIIAGLVASGSSQAANLLSATANYSADHDNDLLDRGDGINTTSDTLPTLDYSFIDPQGKASGTSFASYGTLKASAVMDPDVQDFDFSSQGIASFADTLTITGSNTGALAIATFKLHVTGEVHQPFVVSEVVGYASADSTITATSPLDSQSALNGYNVAGIGGPLYTFVNEDLVVTVPFNVGDSIDLYANLQTATLSNNFNTAPEALDFAALFGNTAQLLPIELSGVSDPVITSSSGTSYALPEPTSLGLLGLGTFAMLRRRK